MPSSPRRARTAGSAAGQAAHVVALLERYAAADRDLARELADINADASSSRRVSQSTVTRLVRLVEQSLVPGVQAKAHLAALPQPIRRAGIAQWAHRTIAGTQSATAGSAR